MQLLEKKHSPLYDYSEEVKNLYNLINEKIKQYKKSDNYEIIRNFYFSDDIILPAEKFKIIISDFNSLGFSNINIKNLNLVFTIYNTNSEEFKDYFYKNSKISDYFISDRFHNTTNQKFSNTYFDLDNENLEFEIITYHYQINPQDFFRLFYHEFNHVFKDCNLLKNNNKEYLNSIYDSWNIKEIIRDITFCNKFSEKEKHAINNIIYKLYSKDELYAFSNSIDGELYVILSDKKYLDDINTGRVLMQTNIWQTYLDLHKDIKIVESISSEKLFELCRFMARNDIYNEVNSRIFRYYDNSLEDDFKNYFIKLANKRLSIFKSRISKILNNYIEINESFARFNRGFSFYRRCTDNNGILNKRFLI